MYKTSPYNTGESDLIHSGDFFDVISHCAGWYNKRIITSSV